jgi:type IV secretory pathway VirB10-like protein
MRPGGVSRKRSGGWPIGTIKRNMDVQPTLQIRPGYKFNVLVDQDIVFPAN